MNACPARCGRTRSAGHVLCRECWHAVAANIRRRVWRLYREQRGSPEHLGAIRDAIRFAQRRIPESQSDPRSPDPSAPRSPSKKRQRSAANTSTT